MLMDANKLFVTHILYGNIISCLALKMAPHILLADIYVVLFIVCVTCYGNRINVLNSLEQDTHRFNNTQQGRKVTTKSNETVEKKSEVVTIIFAGDISLDNPIRTDNGSACSYDGLLAGIKKYFREVDYTMVNLESPFVTKEMAKQIFFPEKGIHNKGYPEGIETLTSAGINGTTIANNHLGDYGGDAVLLTHKILTDNNIDVIGMTEGYYPPYTRQTPLIKEINGVKIGFLAYCGDTTGECINFRPSIKAGPALLEKETVENDLSLLKPQVDIVILFLHWGKEYMSIPEEEERELAINLGNLGVDLIVGSHPHVLQGHEWINNTLVHYSLGNFVFHPHFTFMGALTGKNKTAIHEHYMELSKKSRGPAGNTELFKVVLTKKGVKEGYYLPVRIHVSNETGCLYPRAKVEDNWLKICGPSDDNCYVPRQGEPIYP